jgi:RimJ/RimL family protein N-acetyltransferase
MTAAQLSCTAPPGDLCIRSLETERLILRAPRLEDAPSIAALANNRKIAEMTASIPHPYGLVCCHCG